MDHEKQIGFFTAITIIIGLCMSKFLDSQNTINVIARGVSFGKDGVRSGSGLGVYQAKTTITSFGGKIEFSSMPGDGTAVKIYIPFQLS